MSELFAARAQMGSSLAFHIVFAALGIGLPLFLLIAEGLWLRTRNPVYLELTRTWTKAFAVLFAVGAVSGTVLSFELGLLWPRFMQFAGGIIGMPFSAEGFAFFIEAIFLGLYLYGRERVSPFVHWLFTIPIAVSGLVSGIFVITANAWMNAPAGFDLVDGEVRNVDPLAAMFNPAWLQQSIHMSLAAYIATGFAVAGVYAVAVLRGKRDAYHRTGLALGMIVGAVAMPLQFVSGDAIARMVAENQPVKLAAMEGQFQTESCAPLRIGGLPDPDAGTTRYALEIPCGLSLLARGDRNAVIQGLDEFPRSDIPDPRPVHVAFQVMVGIGTGLLALAVGFWLLAWRGRSIPLHRPLMWAVAVAAPAGFVAIEAGWVVTEVGRQPWIIYNVLRTRDAVTTAPGLVEAFAVFTLLYIALAVVCGWLLLRIAGSGALGQSGSAPSTYAAHRAADATE